jgi:branched-chain amino acid transport system permease protein
MTAISETLRTSRPRLRMIARAAPIAVLLMLVPFLVDSYQTLLITYGLIYAIAALGFNLLLGYTGLLSFGHSAYFGVGAYSVAFMVKYLGIHSMELYIVLGMALSAMVSALFGYVCVRHTRISSAS